MSQRQNLNNLSIILFALAVAAVFLLVHGYSFNTNDQAEHLPQVYQMLDPELYPNDYFVPITNAQFTVRHFYEQFVLGVHHAIGLEWGLFGLTFLCVALMAYAFMRIAQRWFRNAWAVVLAPVFGMLVFYGFTVGGNHIMYGSFVSSTAAKSLAAFALWRWISGRQLSAAMVLGVATLFQALVGLQLFVILAGYVILFRRSVSGLLRLAFGYMAVAGFVLVPVFMRQFGVEESFDKELYYEILYRFRNHHHYLPSLFPLTHYIKLVLLLISAGLGYAFVRPQDRGFFPALALFGLLGMIFYSTTLEVLDVHAIGKVQWFKVTVWLAGFSGLMWAGVFGQLLAGFVPFHRMRAILGAASSVCIVVLLFGITHSKYLPERFDGKYMIGERRLSDREKMHRWISSNTPKDVVVLVSPENNAFACQAKRPMPVHYQAIIHEPFFMMPWYETFSVVYGVTMENLEGVDARAQAADVYASRYIHVLEPNIDMRLDDLRVCGFEDELGTVIHKQGPWVLSKYLPE